MVAQKPIWSTKAGQISASVWQNEITVNGTTKTILKSFVSRRYKDKDGQWKSSQSFSRNEIPLVIYCLQKAFERIIDEQLSDNGNDKIEEEVVM